MFFLLLVVFKIMTITCENVLEIWWIKQFSWMVRSFYWTRCDKCNFKSLVVILTRPPSISNLHKITLLAKPVLQSLQDYHISGKTFWYSSHFTNNAPKRHSQYIRRLTELNGALSRDQCLICRLQCKICILLCKQKRVTRTRIAKTIPIRMGA